MGTEQPTGALDGVRVVDLTTVLMGPLAARMLGDHGADVIRVEAPGSESARNVELGREANNAISLSVHRNKRSVALDLKTTAGAAAMRDLVASADVLVTNMRSAALARLGLDAATLRAGHPSLIHCVANGYGADGPYADRPAYDDAIQAASGLAALHGRVSGEPRFVPSAIVDKICALKITQAVLAALVHQRSTGAGQAIVVPMFETMAEFNLVEHFRGAALVPPAGEIGYARVLSPNRRPYRCRDGYVCLLPYSTAQWHRFFTLTGNAEMIDDPRWASQPERIRHIDELYGFVAEQAVTKTVDEWLTLCDEQSIPATPVLDIADLPDDPHLQAVGLFTQHTHPSVGEYLAIEDAVAYEATPTKLWRHAPNPGEHTAEIMTELGWTPAQIEDIT